MSETIFTPQCALPTCHGTTDPAVGLVLEGDEATVVSELAAVPSAVCDPPWLRVVSGDPEASVLVAKLSDPAPCGDPMPIGGMLAPEEIACVEGWIQTLDPAACETCGGQACIDLQGDAANCGACDNVCPPGVGCSGGECACPEGTKACGDACVDVFSDPAHCGECDMPCDGGLVCNMGVCSSDCGALTQCGAACVDQNTNPLHCGDCDSPCPIGSSCEGGSCACPGGPLSYAADIEPIFVSSCTAMACHAGPMPKAGLDLRAGAGLADLVGVASTQCASRPRVAPSDPQGSYLMDKLLGIGLCMGTRMPKADESLPQAEIDAVSSWICQGAPP